MCRKMLRIKQRPNELNEAYHHRVAFVSAKVRNKLNVRCWGDTYATAIWKFAGHIARMKEYDVGRPTYQALPLQSRNFLKNIEAAHRGSQLHGYRFRVWRFERHFYEYAEKQHLKDWKELAASRRSWMEHLEIWLSWRKEHSN